MLSLGSGTLPTHYANQFPPSQPVAPLAPVFVCLRGEPRAYSDIKDDTHTPPDQKHELRGILGPSQQEQPVEGLAPQEVSNGCLCARILLKS